MKFSDIIGQDELKGQLVRSVDHNRVSHAQLFTGSSGAGLLPMAVAYIQYLNCENRVAGDSCGECANCHKIASLEHPDVHLVFPVNKQGKKSGEVVLSDGFLPTYRELFRERRGYFTPQDWYSALDLGKTLKGAITAKEADTIIKKLSLKAFEAKYKTMLIWLPEMMNEEASNKILKILEEPWDNTIFILVSERPDRLLQTILSRTQQVAVPRLSTEVLEQRAIEVMGADPLRARNMARIAGGDLLELESIISGEQDQTHKEHFELFKSLMRLSYTKRHLELIDWAEQAAAQSRDRQQAFLLNSSRLLRESYMLNAGAESISYLWGEELAFCTKFAPFVTSKNIEQLIAEIETAFRQLTQNGNPTIVFTHFALSVSKMI